MLPEVKIEVYDCRIDVKPADTPDGNVYEAYRGETQVVEIPFEDSIRNSLEAFESCVRTGVQSPSGPDQSLRVMQVLEAAQRQLGK